MPLYTLYSLRNGTERLINRIQESTIIEELDTTVGWSNLVGHVGTLGNGRFSTMVQHDSKNAPFALRSTKYRRWLDQGLRPRIVEMMSQAVIEGKCTQNLGSPSMSSHCYGFVTAILSVRGKQGIHSCINWPHLQ